MRVRRARPASQTGPGTVLKGAAVANPASQTIGTASTGASTLNINTVASVGGVQAMFDALRAKQIEILDALRAAGVIE